MQQITRGDYLKDLITIFIENNLQTDITELYSQFIFQCGEIQKVLTPAQVIKISFDEIESQLLKSTNTCYLAGITTDGHKETFNGSLTFNTRGEVVYYEPPVSTVIPAATETNCDCQGLRGVFYNCSQPAVKAYFSLNYVPTKLSELQNDTDFVDSFDLTRAVSEHNTSTEAHQYIQDLVATEASLRASQTNALGIRIGTEESVRASQTEALHQSILAEATATEEAISLAISTTEGYADTQISNHNSSEQAHPYIQSALVSATEAIQVQIGDLDNLDTSVKSSVVNAINSEVTARENADNNLQGQIDGLAAASDVTDIVGTYQDLQNYDTQHLNDNDIIKVLSDSTHDDQPSYYRFDKDTDTFSYIGSESASYTKAQSDSIFVTQTTEINGHALSSDINLTPSDIGALADSYATVISANTSAIASNTSVIAQHTTEIASNTSDISTINGKIPTDASSSNKLVSASTLSASIANFANKDLNNLTSNGEAHLHALKAYADNGELLTDADGLAFVENYAHSTFDLSKFTVVGSPNITDDGIASGFSSSDYLSAQIIDYTKPFDIYIQAKKDQTGSDYTRLIGFNGANDNVNIIQFGGQSNNKYRIGFVLNGVSVNITSDYVINPSEYYDYHVYWTGTMYGFEYKKATEGNYTSINTVASTTAFTSTSSTISIGYATGANSTGLTLNLKQFSITADGVEVFSGNKTGIDTIKPDNYTVVGTPTISADGIASGFSSSNYINASNLSISSSSEIVIKFRNIIKSSSSSVYLSSSTLAFNIEQYSSTLSTAVRMTNSSGVLLLAGGVISSQNAEIGDVIDTIITLKSGANKLEVYRNGTLYQSATNTNTFTTDQTFNLFRIGNNISNAAQYSRNDIDLNAFKIYVDGNLVYQPCLKIPYTESKTGSKIVDAIYRDRVNDMAEQFGYANYYTLSDTDFTLPQVELYGLIQRQNFAPSDKYDELTLGASGSTYTVPADGWFTINKVAGDAGAVIAFNNNTSSIAVSQYAVSTTNTMRLYCPAKKNDIVRLDYSSTGTTNLFRFIYSEGSESEAN